jgi:hypothetical protein
LAASTLRIRFSRAVDSTTWRPLASGTGAADEPGVAALGHDRRAVGAARPHDSSDFGGRAGPDDGERAAVKAMPPVDLVRRAVVADEHLRRADPRRGGRRARSSRCLGAARRDVRLEPDARRHGTARAATARAAPARSRARMWMQHAVKRPARSRPRARRASPRRRGRCRRASPLRRRRATRPGSASDRCRGAGAAGPGSGRRSGSTFSASVPRPVGREPQLPGQAERDQRERRGDRQRTRPAHGGRRGEGCIHRCL